MIVSRHEDGRRQQNAVIVSGVLAMALIANWLASRFPSMPIGTAYIARNRNLRRFVFRRSGQVCLPVIRDEGPRGRRGVTTCPMLFSGLIFVRSFANAEHKGEALRRRRTIHALSCRRFGAFAPVVAACGAGLYTWLFRGKGDTQPSDFQPLWEATRAWWHGINPYTIPGPFEWSHHYLAYPMPAVLVASPFAALPLRWAETLFVALGFGALAFVLTRDRWRRPGPPWVFASIVGVFVAQHAQWSMLMTAAPFVPAALGFVLVCKPTIGLALFAARPSKAAARGCAVVTVVSLLVFPGWPKAWWEATRPIANVVGAPVMHLGGVLVLAALARWRRADARLLVALALVPQTPMIHEAVPLFLIAETLEEGAILAMLTLVAFAALFRLGPYPDQSAFYAMSGRLMVWCLYLPATIIVCRRPNVATALLEARD